MKEKKRKKTGKSGRGELNNRNGEAVRTSVRVLHAHVTLVSWSLMEELTQMTPGPCTLSQPLLLAPLAQPSSLSSSFTFIILITHSLVILSFQLLTRGATRGQSTLYFYSFISGI